MLSCKVWSHEKFIEDGGRSSVCLNSVAIHDEFSADLGGVCFQSFPFLSISFWKIQKSNGPKSEKL
jgi:hypothetical protein